jgi:hypothetical protein
MYHTVSDGDPIRVLLDDQPVSYIDRKKAINIPRSYFAHAEGEPWYETTEDIEIHSFRMRTCLNLDMPHVAFLDSLRQAILFMSQQINENSLAEVSMYRLYASQQFVQTHSALDIYHALLLLSYFQLNHLFAILFDVTFKSLSSRDVNTSTSMPLWHAYYMLLHVATLPLHPTKKSNDIRYDLLKDPDIASALAREIYKNILSKNKNIVLLCNNHVLKQEQPRIVRRSSRILTDKVLAQLDRPEETLRDCTPLLTFIKGLKERIEGYLLPRWNDIHQLWTSDSSEFLYANLLCLMTYKALTTTTVHHRLSFKETSLATVLFLHEKKAKLVAVWFAFQERSWYPTIEVRMAQRRGPRIYPKIEMTKLPVSDTTVTYLARQCCDYLDVHFMYAGYQFIVANPWSEQNLNRQLYERVLRKGSL